MSIDLIAIHTIITISLKPHFSDVGGTDQQLDKPLKSAKTAMTIGNQFTGPAVQDNCQGFQSTGLIEPLVHADWLQSRYAHSSHNPLLLGSLPLAVSRNFLFDAADTRLQHPCNNQSANCPNADKACEGNTSGKNSPPCSDWVEVAISDCCCSTERPPDCIFNTSDLSISGTGFNFQDNECAQSESQEECNDHQKDKPVMHYSSPLLFGLSVRVQRPVRDARLLTQRLPDASHMLTLNSSASATMLSSRIRMGSRAISGGGRI